MGVGCLECRPKPVVNAQARNRWTNAAWTTLRPRSGREPSGQAVSSTLDPILVMASAAGQLRGPPLTRYGSGECMTALGMPFPAGPYRQFRWAIILARSASVRCGLIANANSARVSSTVASTSLRSGKVEAIKIHHLVPCSHEVTHARLLRVVTCVDFRDSSEL